VYLLAKYGDPVFDLGAISKASGRVHHSMNFASAWYEAWKESAANSIRFLICEDYILGESAEELVDVAVAVDLLSDRCNTGHGVVNLNLATIVSLIVGILWLHGIFRLTVTRESGSLPGWLNHF